MSAITTSKNNSTESRALQLLGSGINPETVAAACGVSVSRISQLLSEPEFTAQVAELRFNNLQKHNATDAKYDEMEDTLLERLKDCLPLIMMDPMKLLKAISVINNAKRRGVSAPEQITAQNTVVQLVMPNIIVQKFTTNINNQVIHAGEQTLETIPSHMLASKYKENTIEAVEAEETISSQALAVFNIMKPGNPASNKPSEPQLLQDNPNTDLTTGVNDAMQLLQLAATN